MKKFVSIDEVLDFAIDREKEAQVFYQRLADMVKKPELVKIINGFAAEEVEHKVKLEALKGQELVIEKGEVGNLNIADYVSDIEPHPNMNYTELLVVAMKKEKLSYKLYMNLFAVAQRKEFTADLLK